MEYAPVASGTVGSLWGIALRVCVQGPWAYVALAGLAAVGVWASGRCENMFSKKDDGRIVIDEVVGMWLACVAFPVGIGVLVACFLLFRFWDIAKPPPLSYSQELKGGWGVMADDLLAGALAAACVAVALKTGLL